MRIAIYSKRHTGLFAELQTLFEADGHTLSGYDLSNTRIDDHLKDYDLVIIKSKHLYFLYAGYYAQAQGVRVVPEPEMTRRISTRIEFPFIAKEVGVPTPEFYFGTRESLVTQLAEDAYPLLWKGIVGGGSSQLEFVESPDDIPETDERFTYLEAYLPGTHYLVYFIGAETRVYEKEPFVNEHHPVRAVDAPDDILDIVARWKATTKMSFGDLDLVREASSGTLYLVDPGVFPQFKHWPGAAEALLPHLLGES